MYKNSLPNLSKRKAMSADYAWIPSLMANDDDDDDDNDTAPRFKHIKLTPHRNVVNNTTTKCLVDLTHGKGDGDGDGDDDGGSDGNGSDANNARHMHRQHHQHHRHLRRTYGGNKNKNNNTTHASRGVTKDVKRIIWQRHFGHAKQGTCPVCGETQLHRDHNSGFDAAHIVPHAYSKHHTQNLRGPDLAVYLVPSCATCNNSMSTRHLLDYMYMYGRARLMCVLMWKWFQGYTREEPLRRCKGVLWQLVDYLFGPSRYPDKGRMEFQTDIYRNLKRHQLVHISDDVRVQREKLHQLLQLADQVDQRIND